VVSKGEEEQTLGEPHISCVVTSISYKLFNLDIECTQYTHKIYVVTAQLQKD
jgi:hypothetical protein